MTPAEDATVGERLQFIDDSLSLIYAAACIDADKPGASPRELRRVIQDLAAEARESAYWIRTNAESALKLPAPTEDERQRLARVRKV